MAPVTGNESPHSPDRDDWFADDDNWFAEPGRPRGRSLRGVEADDEQDWFEPASRREYRRGLLGDMTVTLRTLVIGGAVAAAVLVLIGLAAAGVFSGSSHPNAAAPPPASTPTTSSTTGSGQNTTPTTPRPAAAPSATLKPGDTGAQVKVLQRALARLGYSPGAVDGDYGPSTTSAVQDFQRASGLAPDGVVGSKTLQALRHALAKSG